jgi:hypothetical protein
LGQKASTPTARAWAIFRLSKLAVNIKSGTVASFGSARTKRAAEMPSIPGSTRSIRMQSTC